MRDEPARRSAALIDATAQAEELAGRFAGGRRGPGGGRSRLAESARQCSEAQEQLAQSEADRTQQAAVVVRTARNQQTPWTLRRR